MTNQKTREQVACEVTKYFKPKVPKERVPVDLEVAAKVYTCVNNPPG